MWWVLVCVYTPCLVPENISDLQWVYKQSCDLISSFSKLLTSYLSLEFHIAGNKTLLQRCLIYVHNELARAVGLKMVSDGCART